MLEHSQEFVNDQARFIFAKEVVLRVLHANALADDA